MRKFMIEFYCRDESNTLKLDEIVVKDYEAALRYAKAMVRAHGWTILSIKDKSEPEQPRVHDLRR